MSNKKSGELDWTAKTVAIAILASVCGLLLGLGLRRLQIWPRWNYGEFVFGALCGATAVYSMHRQRLLIVLLIFVPVMTALLLVGTILFHLYVLREPLEL